MRRVLDDPAFWAGIVLGLWCCGLIALGMGR